MAVVLSGYNRDARLTGNTFYLLGGSAVVLWGHETNGDGTDGNQPRRTTVSENFCHGEPASKLRRSRLRSHGIIVSRVLRAEIGIYQKQSSCYFHAVSAQSTVTNNLFFNGPRAMVRLMRLPAPYAITFYTYGSHHTRASPRNWIRRVLPCMPSAHDRHSVTAAAVRPQVNFVSGIGAHSPAASSLRTGLLTAVGRRMTRSAGGMISATI